MANSVDRRVLEMRFDNRDFEKNIGDTLISLETLQKALQLQEKGGLDKTKNSISQLGDSVKNIDTGNLMTNIDRIANRFSTLGVIGTAVLQKVGYAVADLGFALVNKLMGPLNQIKSGGFSRALDIEQARFQIKGLGFDVEEVMKNANDAVSGTAYGLNEAAKAASVLAASGIKAGQEMTDVLTSIAGAAAMTGRNYSDIADIYSTVAGNGRLMTQQLRQFSASGLNVSAVLAKAFNKTEQEINEMVSKGEISFKEFSEAMMDFGDHAKAANDTFSGSMSNMKAALSRIGASFYSPMLEHARDIFNALTPAIDNIHNALKPLFKFIDNIAVKGTEKLVGLIESITKNFNVVDRLGKFKFGGDFWDKISNLDDKSKGIKITSKNIEELSSKGVNGLKILAKYFDTTEESVTKMVKNGKVSMEDFGKAITKYVKDSLADGTTTVTELARAFGVSEKVIKFFNNALKGVQDGILAFKTFKADSIFDKITFSIRHFLKAFTEEKSSPKWLNDVTDALYGVSAAISLLKKGGKTLLEFAKPALGPLKELGLLLLSVAGAIGRFLMRVDDGTSALSLLKDGIIKLSKSAFGNLSTVIRSLTNLGRVITDSVGNGLDLLSDKIKSLTDGYAFKGLETLAKGLGKAFTFIKETIASLDFSAIGGLMLGGGVLAGGLKFASFIDLIKEKLFGLGKETSEKGPGLKEQLSDILGGLSDSLNEFQSSLKIGRIITIAVGIAILAHSCATLANIPTNKLIASVGAIGILAQELVATSKKIESIESKGFIALAFSIFILSKAVKTLGEMDIDDLAKGLGGVAVSLLTFAGFFKLLNNKIISTSSARISSIAKSLIVLGIALTILTIPIKILGGMDIKALGKGLGSIAIALLTFAGFFKLLNSKIINTSSDRISSIAKSLILLGIALTILVIPIKVLGGMNIESLAKGLGAIAIALLMFAGFFKLMSSNIISTSSDRISKIAGSLVVFGIALTILTIPIKSLGNMPLKNLGQGLLGIAGALLIIAGFVKLLDTIDVSAGDLLKVSASLTIMGIAITLIAGSIAIMSGINSASGLLILAVVLIELAIAVHAMEDTTSGALAMLVVAAALMIMAPALVKLSTIKFSGMIIGLLALAGAIAIFGVAATVLSVSIPFMLAFGAALALFGVGILGVGAGMMLLATAFSTGATAIINGIKTIISFIPAVAAAIGEGLIAILNKFIEAAPTIQIAIEQFVLIMIQVLTNAIPRLVDAGIQLILHLLAGIRDNIGKVVNLAADIIVNFINGIASRIGDVIDAGWNLIISFITGMTDSIDKNGPILKAAIMDLFLACAQQLVSIIPFFGDSAAKSIADYRKQLKKGGEGAKKDAKKTGKEVGKNLKVDDKETKKSMDDYAKSVEKGSKAANKSAKKVADESAKGLKIKSQKSNGENSVKGIIQGMDAQLPSLRRKSNQIADIVDKTIRKKNEIKSPSRRLARTGKYLMQGLMIGIDSLTGEYQKKTDNIATTFIASTNSAIGSMSSISGPSLNSTIARTSDVNLRMDDLSRENDKLANGISQLTKTLSGMTDSMNSRALNNYINIDGSGDPEAFADGLIRSFRLNARTV